MAVVPATFNIGFTIPEISVYQQIPTAGPPYRRREVRDAFLDAGRGWYGVLSALPGDAPPWVDDFTVEDGSGHADDADIRSEINTRLLHLDGDGKYTAGSPTADGVIYVWINGSRVCIHTFGLLETVGANTSPVVHSVSGPEGTVTVGYWASLYWA